jgi:hypothetical protein
MSRRSRIKKLQQRAGAALRATWVVMDGKVALRWRVRDFQIVLAKLQAEQHLHESGVLCSVSVHYIMENCAVEEFTAAAVAATRLFLLFGVSLRRDVF